MRYFKGHAKDNHCHVFFKMYDEPKKKTFGLGPEIYIIERYLFGNFGITRYETVEDCQKENYILREISEAEFNLYSDTQRLLNEVFLNQFVGGFPEDTHVLDRQLKFISKDVQAIKKELFENPDTPSGMPDGIYNG